MYIYITDILEFFFFKLHLNIGLFISFSMLFLPSLFPPSSGWVEDFVWEGEEVVFLIPFLTYTGLEFILNFYSFNVILEILRILTKIISYFYPHSR